MVAPYRRILVVDDNRDIHDDFRKLLGSTGSSADLDAMAAELFDLPPKRSTLPAFELSFASQGAEGFEMVSRGASVGMPYALVFMDMRMPPGWDGLETLERIWSVDSQIQAVICTAYSDYSWEQINDRLGPTDRLLVLKKPFDSLEVRQIALALTEKWNDHRERLESEAHLRSLLRELEARRDEAVRSATDDAAPGEHAETQRGPVCPVVPIQRGILAVPLVGQLDAIRVHAVAGALVAAVTGRSASVLVLDGSCLSPGDDGGMALAMIVQAVEAAGCRVVLSGMPGEPIEGDPIAGPFWEDDIDGALARALQLVSSGASAP